MTAQQLGKLLERSETHRLIVGNHPGPYALGVTHAPDPSQGFAFVLKIADPTGVPDSVEIEGQRIPVIVQGGFRRPVPLREASSSFILA